MKLKVVRFSDNKESTLGLLFLNGIFECFTLEDEKRTKKIFGETRIPEGIYDIALRKEGSHHNRYLGKFGPDFHKGMLHVKNVPNFKWILIHIGNSDDDTAGCLLLGDVAYNNKESEGFIGQSTVAYTNMYSKVIQALKNKESVTIEYINIEGK